MKAAVVFVGFLSLFTAVAQQHDELAPEGTIYGIAIGQDGQPAKGIELNARPLGVFVFRMMLPHARTNDVGEYRFENLDWGRYTVFAEDEKAGYSSLSTGPSGDRSPPEVELSPAHPDAEFKVYLPPKAGFLQIHLTNRRTGGGIGGVQVSVLPIENPELPLFTVSCGSTHVILVPPDKNLLIHVTSEGFREWDESVGKGRAINIPSGTRRRLAMRLEPSD